MENDERTYQVQLAKILWGGFYKCPNSPAVLAILPHDDKVLCGCGKPNPKYTREPPGHHVASLLEVATAEEFVDYEDTCRAKFSWGIGDIVWEKKST